MTPDELLHREQAADGCLQSTVRRANGRLVADHNGFATALVARALDPLGDSPFHMRVRSRALDAVERCEVRDRPGWFTFWSPDRWPSWVPSLGPDVDDSAVMALELLRSGRRDQRWARDAACELVAAGLVTRIPRPAPPWLRPLVFRTWPARVGETSSGCDLVDCVVNANVLALLRACRLTGLPGYLESVAMIGDAVAWAARASPQRRHLRLRTLAPYYPDPASLLDAVEHAVVSGVDELLPARDMLLQLLRSTPATDGARGAVCGDAYSGVMWWCPALQAARRAAAAVEAGDAATGLTAQSGGASKIERRVLPP